MSVPIRVGFLVDSMHVGGSELHSLKLLEALPRSDVAPYLYHMGEEGPLLERYQALNIPMVHVRVTGFARPGMLRTVGAFVRQLRTDRIQVLQTHDIYSNIIAAPCGRLAGVPVVLTGRRWTTAVPSRMHAFLNSMALRGSTAVLTNAKAVAELVRTEDRVPADQILVLPNLLPCEAFDSYPPVERAQLHRALGIPEGTVVGGIVARLSRVKAHADLLTAVAIVARRHPDFHLIVIGDGPEREGLVAQSHRLGLQERVHFLGHLADHPNPHGLLDVSILASVAEGSPNTLAEAMAAGNAVVATAVGGVPEIVEDGVTGLLVPPRSPDRLADALSALALDPQRRRRMGAAGLARAKDRFMPGRIARDLVTIYRRLLGDR